MTSTLYLVRSTFSNPADPMTGNSNPTPTFPSVALVVTDDTTNVPTVTNPLSMNSWIFASGNAKGQGDLAANWNLQLLPSAQGSYSGQGLKVYPYDLAADWDPAGDFLTADYIQTTDDQSHPQKLGVKVNQVDVDDAAPLRFAKPGDFTMVDVDAGGQNPSWLSTDTRTFRIQPGSNVPVGQSIPLPLTIGDLWSGASNPNWSADNAAKVVSNIRNWLKNGGEYDEARAALFLSFFQQLAPDEGPGATMQEAQLENAAPVYNIALARVRAVNTGAGDSKALVTFRLFVSLNANLAYPKDNSDPLWVNYPYATPAPTNVGRIPILGRSGANADPVCFPVFGDARLANAAWPNESLQTDGINELSFTSPTDTKKQHRDYFGVAHVDINDATVRYPDATNNLQKLSDIIKQAHVCMVVEVVNPLDPTFPGSNPQSSGNLAQRNLAIGYVNNPGLDEAVRTVQHNFEFVPSKKAVKGEAPNQLLFLTRGVPAGTTVEVFLPGLDVEKVLAAAHATHSPVIAASAGRVQFRLAGAFKFPVDVAPGRHPALVTVHLPAAADIGREYVIDVLQLDPVAGLVVGAFRLKTPVVKARLALPGAYAAADRAVHRAASAAPASPWNAVLKQQAAFATNKARSTAFELVKEVGMIAGRPVTVVLDKIEVPIARATPLTVQAAVYEGGMRVATRAVSIPAGPAGVVTLGESIFTGAVVDHLLVKLEGEVTPGRGPILLHERAFHPVAGVPLAHEPSIATSDRPSAASWRVWFHVVPGR